MIASSDTLRMIWLRHRDPPRLWASVALMSLVFHGVLLWISWPRLHQMAAQLQPESNAIPIPIDLVALPSPPEVTAAGAESSGANPNAIAAHDPTAANSPHPSSLNPNHASNSPAATTTPPASQGQPEVPNVNPSNINSSNINPSNNISGREGQPPAAPSESGNPTGNTPAAPSPEPTASSTDPPNQTPSPSPGDTSNPGNGRPGDATQPGVSLQILSVARRDDLPDYARDLPDQMARPRETTFGIAWVAAATCTVANPTAMTRYAERDLTVALRLTVEANGRVSQVNARPYQSSGDPGFDEFMHCLIEAQDLRFVAAQSGGQPVATDWVILTLTLSPWQG